ncbi:hypothetical protein HQ393_09195 [Chitinibacter bivalviorum]|uniref:Uncharacterized protein n=1 Tax=Chitinibacter bivalviorum TaxID=2739434 RepID=A0A7H9BIV5_9NEIS|nr:hypothetical protein [Chitinibacter bivalviorum]QLG88409.1 hypothetical protein HQ393_09195 [Chitinibacter bivalviorum]
MKLTAKMITGTNGDNNTTTSNLSNRVEIESVKYTTGKQLKRARHDPTKYKVKIVGNGKTQSGSRTVFENKNSSGQIIITVDNASMLLTIAK